MLVSVSIYDKELSRGLPREIINIITVLIKPESKKYLECFRASLFNPTKRCKVLSFHSVLDRSFTSAQVSFELQCISRVDGMGSANVVKSVVEGCKWLR